MPQAYNSAAKFSAVAIVLFLIPPLAFAGQLDILSVSGASASPSKIYAGDTVTLNFNVSNISGVGQAADKVIVRTELNENYFEVQKAEEKFDSIGSKSSKTASFRFRLRDDAPSGNYRLPVILEYDSGSSRIVQKDEVNFSVAACNALKIEGIRLDDARPHIGGELGITATIKNSCTVIARNVSVVLSPVTNPTIAPFIVPSGTTNRVGDIAGGESKDTKFSVTVGDKVDAKTYVFSVDANCDQCSRQVSDAFSFQVLGRPEPVFSNIEYSVENQPGNDKRIMQGSSFTLSVQMDNIGQEKAKAVEVNIDFGREIAGSSKAFLGNINPDDSGAAVFNLSAAFDAAAGPHQGTVNVRYVDELGQRQEFSQGYALYVNPQPPTSPVIYIAILALLAAVLGIIYFIIKFIFRHLAIRKAQSR